MISDYLNRTLPSTEELPCSDDIPVDNVGVSTSRSEDQNFLPNVLLFLLRSISRPTSRSRYQSRSLTRLNLVAKRL